MHNESYEEYIRSILGYPNYNSNNFENTYNYMSPSDTSTNQDDELENCYPEIYKIVYPMITKACSSTTRPVTPELVDELTDEIYSSIETNSEINVNINLTNQVKSSGTQNTISKNSKREPVKENRVENRQFRNTTLHDLIRILLIRELLKRRRRFPGNRPPFPPGSPPMRPPFPGGPGGGGRPPMMSRQYDYFDSNIYE